MSNLRLNASQVKCGHCHTYHASTRDVFFCTSGPRAAQMMATNARVAAREAVAPRPRPNEWSFRTPISMVKGIKDGRYAVRPDSATPYTFIRVSRPKNGRKKGCLVIQTQHSDWYKDGVVIYPNDSVWINNVDIDHPLLLVAVDQMGAAINYGRELGRCSCCGRELTDERSRYYSIGPECEKRWPEIILHINETRGEFALV